jgi:hypothetical protein
MNACCLGQNTPYCEIENKDKKTRYQTSCIVSDCLPLFPKQTSAAPDIGISI